MKGDVAKKPQFQNKKGGLSVPTDRGGGGGPGKSAAIGRLADCLEAAVEIYRARSGRRRGDFSMRLMLRFLGLLFAAGTILFVVGVAAAAGLLWHYSQSLPDYSQLQDYEPAVMTRVHASDGSLLAEYARERRLYIPIQAVPKLVTPAFVAAEDKNFYEHGGIDLSGIARAAPLYIQQYSSGH